MTTIHVEIKNIEEIKSTFKKAPQKMAMNIQVAIDRTVANLQREAKDIIRTGRGYSRRPFASGRMFRSILTERKALGGRVYADVNYALYSHEGLSTSRRYGRRPFMEDAVRDSEQFIDREFAEAVEKSL